MISSMLAFASMDEIWQSNEAYDTEAVGVIKNRPAHEGSTPSLLQKNNKIFITMKPIEEIREYAKEKVGEYDYLGNEYEAYLDGAQDAANHIKSLPLSDRLTAEEREKIKGVYKTSKSIVRIENDSTLMYSMHTQIMCVGVNFRQVYV